MSSGQEVPKTASLSLTVLMVQYYCAYSSVRKFNDMDQTRCPMLLHFLLYGCTWKKKKKKKLFGYSMSVLLPEAVQILVKNKFEITDEEVSLLQLSCMLNV